MQGPASVPPLAWGAFADVVAANSTHVTAFCSLLEMLDAGQLVVLEQVKDAVLREQLQAALDALGLPTEHLPDGTVAHAKPDGMTSSLASEFASIQADRTRTVAVAASTTEALMTESGGLAATAGHADNVQQQQQQQQQRRRAIGPTVGPLPDHPAVMATPAPPPDSTAPAGLSGDDDDDMVGPVIPPPGAGSSSASGVQDASGEGGGSGQAWWQREQAAPKPPALPDDSRIASEQQLARDDWMTSLPSDRTALNSTDQARQFSRNGVQPVGDLSAWTETPSERKRRVAEAAQWGAPTGAGEISGSAAPPMTLAEIGRASCRERV